MPLSPHEATDIAVRVSQSSGSRLVLMDDYLTTCKTHA
jgi:hypothetical protein